jgi:hypothetical protein
MADPLSPEQVALGLTDLIAWRIESKSVSTVDRAYVLDLYAECLEAVRGERKRGTAKSD